MALKSLEVHECGRDEREKGRETKEQAAITIRRKRREALGRAQGKRRNFRLGSQSSLTLLL